MPCKKWCALRTSEAINLQSQKLTFDKCLTYLRIQLRTTKFSVFDTNVMRPKAEQEILWPNVPSKYTGLGPIQVPIFPKIGDAITAAK